VAGAWRVATFSKLYGYFLNWRFLARLRNYSPLLKAQRGLWSLYIVTLMLSSPDYMDRFYRHVSGVKFGTPRVMPDWTFSPFTSPFLSARHVGIYIPLVYP
jgi:hypothetical protein